MDGRVAWYRLSIGATPSPEVTAAVAVAIPSDLPASALAFDVGKPLDVAKDLAPSATSKLRTGGDTGRIRVGWGATRYVRIVR